MESSNNLIALNSLLAQNDKEKIKQTYISKHTFIRLNTGTFMMVMNGQQGRCLRAAKGDKSAFQLLMKCCVFIAAV